MRKDIAGPETESSRPMWESLEGAVRGSTPWRGEEPTL